ncbi:MAG: serine/threonine protein kinase, partial [Friedmanniella sp.]|nr:serine/threonine protein kinase [Friedmanniella sp.]
MTSCAQPGCPGQLLDGYCDVCGSPAPPAPAAASVRPAGAPAAGLLATDAPEATQAARPPFAGAGADACRQPGCPGRVVDGYCDVCGSPGPDPAPGAGPPAPLPGPDPE